MAQSAVQEGVRVTNFGGDSSENYQKDGNGGNYSSGEENSDKMLLDMRSGNGGNYTGGGSETHHVEVQQAVDQQFAVLAAQLGNVAIPAA